MNRKNAFKLKVGVSGTLRALAIVSALPGMLAACGGGGSSKSDVTSAPAASGSAASAPAPAPAPATATGPTSASSTLDVTSLGSGAITSSPAGIDCGTDCSESFAGGTSVALSASPTPGFVFNGWGGDCSGLSTPCVLNMNAARSVTANFVADTGNTASVAPLIAAMPANSWKALPSTQMKDACPLPYNAYACQNVVAAWGGGAYDEARERMVIYGGGHSDSWYNNVFAFDLASMSWHRLSEMSAGATGARSGAGWDDSRLESCGFYPKGVPTLPDDVMRGAYVAYEKCFVEPVLSQLDLQQPRSSHTYGKVVVDKVNDRYCYLGGSYWPGAQTTSPVVPCFDPKTRLWSRIADMTVGRGGSAVDARGHIWSMTDIGAPIREYNPRTNTWTSYGHLNYEASGSGDIDRQRGHYYVLHARTDGGYSLRRWDLGSPSSLNARPTYAEIPTTGDVPTALGTRPGFVYADAHDRIYAWGGGLDIYTLDLTTHRWTRVTATGDDPGAQQKWGTFGRFRYSPAHGVFVLVNDTRQNVFIYKPAR